MHDIDSYTEAIIAGDTTAFGHFMAMAEGTVRDSLRSFAGRVDTESVLQETFLRIWQIAPRFENDGKPNGLLRLALRIARNLAISETRRLRTGKGYADDLYHRVQSLQQGQGPTPPDPMLRRVIDGCRARLPKKPAQALAQRLASAGGLADSALAARVGMTKNTFLQNFTRARKFLAQCLRDSGIDLEVILP